MPGNGLLYKPPHACGCYVTVKLNGFNALAPEGPQNHPSGSATPAERLEKGPAYALQRTPRAATEDTGADWPVYRHDAGRSGVTDAAVPHNLKLAWRSSAFGTLTPPTVAGNTAYTTCPDRHRIVALDIASGKPRWQACVGGRVDSPPTVVRDRVLFGCRDGFVYSLDATDGTLAWRFRVAASAHRAVAYDRLESVSPIHGSVLVRNDEVTVLCGRSSFLDGGLHIVRLDARTGNMLSDSPLHGPALEPTPKPEQFGPNAMPGARWDLLVADDENIFLQDLVLDKVGASVETGKPHLFALTGFLDDSWTHRSYWIYGDKAAIATGCSGRPKTLCYGRLLAVDKGAVYGYGRKSVHWSNEFQDGPYRLFRRDHGDDGTAWEVDADLQVRALIKTGDALFAAGSTAPPSAGRGAAEGRHLLLALSPEDGAELARAELPAAPVFDGMAAAQGSLFVSLRDGTLVRLTAK